MMRRRVRQALGLGLVLAFAPMAFGATDGDLAEAKIHLRDHLKRINRKYPFADWEVRLKTVRSSLERLRSKIGPAGQGFDRGIQAQLESVSKDVADLSSRGAETGNLIRELQVASLVSGIDGLFRQDGKTWDEEGKLSFQRTLMNYEAGSLKPKIEFQARVEALARDFLSLQSDWQYAFAQDYLGRRVDEHLRAFEFAKMESLYDDLSLQLDYWDRQTESNAGRTRDQLQALAKRFEENRAWLRRNLESLVEALNTDMLFSDLLEYAARQKVEFGLEVEEKIETSLKERNQGTLAPIQQRLGLWKDFAASLMDKTARAETLAETQQSQVLARAEEERREREMLEALKAEQKRMELEQKEKFKQTLSALKTFTFKSETAVELDDDSKKALSTKAGFLKTSYVRSGSNKLKVEKSLFNDTLAMVQKFSVQDGQVDFSKMSLQERSNQSAYTYASPAGRTSQGDLENFVAEVALGSFSTYYSFLSYIAPARWSAGRAINWMSERAKDKINKDREFSYVDLVVDAHRKRSGGSNRSESNVNLPANMVVIFDPRGAIIRFQSFGDVSQVHIQSGDLVEGKLHYKFLNYSTDRQRIYLNGIDPEMKISVPAGKS